MSPEEVLNCFNEFSNGLSRKNSRPDEAMARTALMLLRVLPASRPAVLDYLGNIYKDFFREYLTKLRHSEKGDHEESDPVVQEVDESLMELTCSEEFNIWSSTLSKWSIKTLGEMCQEFSCQRMLPVATNLSTLQELIRFWTSCSASQSLIALLCTYISYLDEDEMFQCFDSLLITSMKLSPHFDWVVAYVGSRFPDTIIARMLHCGLSDYHQNAGAASPPKPQLVMPPSTRLLQSQSQVPSQRVDVEVESVSRVPSVVGILSHLALDFEEELREKILVLFERSMKEFVEEEVYLTAPLFIFYLASQSTVLLKIILKAFLYHVDTETLNNLADRALKRNYKAYIDFASAVSLMARTLTRVESQAFEILVALMETASNKSDARMETSTRCVPLPVVSHFCYEVMNEVCLILQKLVFSSSMNLNSDVRLLLSVRSRSRELCQLITESSDCRRNWLFKFLSFLSVGDTRGTSKGILVDIFIMERSGGEFSLFRELLKCSELRHSSISGDFADAILSVLESNKDMTTKEMVVQRILNFSSWEMEPEMPGKIKGARKNSEPIYLSLQKKYLRIVLLLHQSSYKMKMDLLRLLNLLGGSRTSDIDAAVALNAARETVSSFYDILFNHESLEKMNLGYECIKYMEKLRCRNYIQNSLVVSIFESALSTENAKLFGGVQDPGEFERNGEWLAPLFAKPNLMEQNRDLSTSSSSSSQLFHSGEINTKPKKPRPPEPTSETRLNIRLVLEALATCSLNSESQKPNATKDELQFVAEFPRAFVEHVMFDSLMNNANWPDEESIKVNSERDLHVKRKFDDQPLLWECLDLLMISPSNAWTCLCVLRSLLGNLIMQWESTRETSVESLPQLLQSTEKVIEYLRKTQVLLEPMSYSSELLPHISPYEVYLLLINIWRYIKEYSPQSGPKRTFNCPQKLLDVLHSIMQNNIETCGHLFPLFFAE